MINITFPDNSVRKYEKGITPYEIAKSISNSLAREVLSASHDDEIIEVHTSIENDGLIKFFKWDDKEGKSAFWHSTAHVLAQVILEIYPHSKLTIGPAIESGFYYDVDFRDHSLSLIHI